MAALRGEPPYSVTSGILSAFGVIGVGYALALQARDRRAARRQAARAYQAGLMANAVRAPGGRPPRQARRHLHLNLILSYWELLYELGELPEKTLRAHVRAELLATPPGRLFWRDTREHRLATARNRRTRRFYDIVDSEYEMGGPWRTPALRVRETALTAVWGLAGLAAGWAIHRILNRLASKP
ncbi:hypothetical protein GCM10023259_076690 [Thermocatellispora tengchongensis]